ncbi:MAG: transcriptional regulator [Solibacterales bacterium]|mgnify:FL=1|nr:transcriptional regulator [Bryobacterales bacterium]|tara:strand:+ start:6040 stop:6474 length:435 start_codon:yes stop_codon:yes gene_type:complete
MDVSVKGEYALRAVFDLAGRDAPGPVKIADIAQRQEIPQKFLELILAQLKKGGFLESRRGADGGYFLAQPATEITIGAVLRHIEGSLSPGRKMYRNGSPENSPFPEFWNQVEQALSGVIDKTTFADLVERWREKNTHRAANWEI